MYICDNMMEATEEGSSRNILLNVYFVVTMITMYILFFFAVQAKLANALVKKKLPLFFQLDNFVDKITFNFHLFNKKKVLLLLDMLLQYSIHFV